MSKWTTEKLKEVIKEAYEKKGSQVYDKWLNSNGFSGPLSRIKKQLGQSLYDFASENGIGEMVTVKHKTNGHTEEFITSEFKRVYRESGELLCDAVINKYGCRKLVVYIRKHFGDLDAFVIKNNLTDIFKKRYEVLTNDAVVNRVINFYKESGRRLCIKDIQNSMNGCAKFIYRNYGGFEEFCTTNKLEYLFEYKGGTTWTHESARETVINLSVVSGCKVSLSDLTSNGFHGLIHYIRREYEGAADFMYKLNLTDYMYVGDLMTAISQGDSFEKLLKECFEALDFNFEYHPRNFEGIVPDFYFKETDTIVDAKLSSYTAFNLTNNFFGKYMSQCTQLTIVYLRGPEMLKRDNGVTFINVSDYFNELEKRGRHDLVTRLTHLKMEVESDIPKGANN